MPRIVILAKNRNFGNFWNFPFLQRCRTIRTIFVFFFCWPRDQELVRLIGQHLVSMGLDKSAEILISETGTKLEHPSATEFRTAILSGEWDRALSALDDLKPQIKKIAKIHSMTFAIFEQKFLELLEEGDCLKAFHCLRLDLGKFWNYFSFFWFSKIFFFFNFHFFF